MTLAPWFLLLCLALGEASAKTVRIALVTGHNRGLDSDVRLQFAESDAQKLAELLQEVGSIEEENIILLKSPRPEDLDRAFGDARALSANAEAGDEVVFLFYYSGHGTGDNLKLGRKTYSLKDLKERINQVPAKLRIGILDACQSGAITRLKGARLVQPFVLEQQLKSSGSILIASSSENENSQESEQLQGSFFTHNLMGALRGAGDMSGDRRVTLLEAYQYAYQKTLVQTESTRGGAQHAMAQINLDVEGDVVLTDLNSGRGGLHFTPQMEGALLVADGRSQVVGEFHKEKGREAFLALPPGSYRIFQKRGRKTLQFKTRLKDREIQEVGQDDMTTGFSLTGFAKGGGTSAEEAESVPLPWRLRDWPAQYPLEIGLGFYNSPMHSSLLASASYRFLPQFALSISYGANSGYNQKVWNGEMLSQDLRFGLQAGKFLAPNLEFMATFFQRASRYGTAGTVFANSGPDCVDSVKSSGCFRVDPGRSPAWDWNAGSGVFFSIRLWLWSRLTLEMGYGTEYTWRESQFNEHPLMFLSGVHF
jgi:hypothetical protein